MDRAELATTLVAARGRLKPADVGLPAGQRRRVPGLRREEVAQLAGVSVDYLVRLEQARGPRPSGQVLGALARALRMSPDERDHLHLLAGAEPPHAGRIDRLVRPSTSRLMERMVDLPVLLIDATGELLSWNELALALLGDLTTLPSRQRNLLRLRFLGGGHGRVVHDSAEDAEASAREAVADLRAAAARFPDDPDVSSLLADLRAGSAEFERLWNEAGVGMRRSSTKTFAHPAVGRITLDCDVLLLPSGDQRLVVYSAEPGTAAAENLDLLRVVGVQDLTRPG